MASKNSLRFAIAGVTALLLCTVPVPSAESGATAFTVGIIASAEDRYDTLNFANPYYQGLGVPSVSTDYTVTNGTATFTPNADLTGGTLTFTDDAVLEELFIPKNIVLVGKNVTIGHIDTGNGTDDERITIAEGSSFKVNTGISFGASGGATSRLTVNGSLETDHSNTDNYGLLCGALKIGANGRFVSHGQVFLVNMNDCSPLLEIESGGVLDIDVTVGHPGTDAYAMKIGDLSNYSDNHLVYREFSKAVVIPADYTVTPDNTVFDLNEDEYFFSYYPCDKNGNRVKALRIVPEAIKPVVTIEADENSVPVSGKNDTYKNSVKLVISAEDSQPSSGIAKMEYSLDGGITFTEIANGGTVTLSTRGAHTVIAKATDNYGNVSEPETKTVYVYKESTVEVTSAGNDIVYDGEPVEEGYDFVVTKTGSSKNYVLSFRDKGGNVLASAPSAVGQYIVTASVPQDDENYWLAAESEPFAFEIKVADMIVIAQGYKGVYDGKPHSIKVYAPEGAVITYSTEEKGTYSEKNPEFTEVGEYTVYYKAELDNHEPVSGKATVIITAEEPAPEPEPEPSAPSNDLSFINYYSAGATVWVYDNNSSLGMSVGSKYVRINLGSSYAGKSFSIYEGRTPSGKAVASGTFNSSGKYVFKGAQTGKTYSLVVSSSAKPAVKAEAGENFVRLSWDKVSGAEKYAVYKVVNGKAKKLGETEKLSVKINGLKSGKEYQYVVRSYADGKWSSMKKSDIVTVTAE